MQVNITNNQVPIYKFILKSTDELTALKLQSILTDVLEIVEVLKSDDYVQILDARGTIRWEGNTDVSAIAMAGKIFGIFK